MCSINVDKKLNLINKYNALKNNRIYKIDDDNKKECEGIMNAYQSHE